MVRQSVVPGEFPHLHPEVASFVLLSSDARIREVHRDLWIPYTRAEDIDQALEDLLNHPPSKRMPNILIIGERGNGKSSIARHFAARHAHADEPGAPQHDVPVLLLESPSAPIEVRIYQEILRTLFSPFHPKAPVSQLRYQVERTLGQIGTRMLIFDELHHLLDGGAVQQQQCLNSLKSLSNTVGVALVGLGTARAERVFGSDDQLADRFEVLELPAWTNTVEWRRLLMTFEQRLPLRKPSGLSSPALASLLHERSGGRLGALVKDLRRAGAKAIRRGTECITLELLETIRVRRPGDTR